MLTLKALAREAVVADFPLVKAQFLEGKVPNGLFKTLLASVVLKGKCNLHDQIKEQLFKTRGRQLDQLNKDSSDHADFVMRHSYLLIKGKPEGKFTQDELRQSYYERKQTLGEAFDKSSASQNPQTKRVLPIWDTEIAPEIAQETAPLIERAIVTTLGRGGALEKLFGKDATHSLKFKQFAEQIAMIATTHNYLSPNHGFHNDENAEKLILEKARAQ